MITGRLSIYENLVTLRCLSVYTVEKIIKSRAILAPNLGLDADFRSRNADRMLRPQSTMGCPCTDSYQRIRSGDERDHATNEHRILDDP